MIDKRNNLQELPKGWVWTILGEILNKISNGITQSQEKENIGIPVTRIETISNGTIDIKRVGYLKELFPDLIEKYKLYNGDVLFSHINSDLHLGKTAIFSFENITLLHGMNLLLLRPNKDIITPKLLNYICNHYRFSGFFISIAHHAVNQSSINQSRLRNLNIPLPPLPEQHRIIAKIEELFTRLDAGVEALKKIKAQIKRYRQAVLKYAFEGKLTEEWRQSELRNPNSALRKEPASVLLERIRKEQKKNAKRKYKELPQVDTSELTELPEAWVWTKLGEMSEIILGQSLFIKAN